jgi:hypothetical protein
LRYLSIICAICKFWRLFGGDFETAAKRKVQIDAFGQPCVLNS